MYSVMIAEDELLVRMGLMTIVDWEKMNMKVVCTAADGTSALESYRQYHPNIIITDLNMPGLHGIELIREIRGKDPQCGILIITCLEQFSFIQEALRLDVDDYFVKATMHIQDIEKALKKIKARLDTRKLSDLPEQASELRSMPLRRYLIERNISYAQLCSLGQDHIILRNVNLMAAKIEKNKDMFHSNYSASLEDLLKNRLDCVDVFFADDEHIILLMKRLAKEAAEAVKNTIDYIRRSLNIGIIVSLVSEPVSPEKLPDVVETIIRSLDHPFMSDRTINIIKASGQPFDEEYLKKMPLLEAYAILNDNRYHSEECQRLYHEFENAAGERQIKEKAKLLMHKMTASDGIESMISQAKGIHECLDGMLNRLSETLNPREARVIPAIVYLKKNLSKPLSLTDVAEQAGMQSQTFALTLKKLTEQTFIELLNAQRIFLAKQLLGNYPEMSLQEICEKCGYSDLPYFYRVFKKTTGLTPGEWRKG